MLFNSSAQSAYDSILESKVIVICRRVYGDKLLALADAVQQGGLPLLEVTFDQADCDCAKKTQAAVGALVKSFPRLRVGTGTVLSIQQVNEAFDAGASYIVSPNADERVIGRAKALGLVSIPGAFTPSEILFAHNAGADIVKLFPANHLGLGYIKDIMAPISHVKLLAAGAVTSKNARDYIDVGMVAVAIGGEICNTKLLSDGNYGEIAARAANIASILRVRQA